jgi:hypothetical protein
VSAIYDWATAGNLQPEPITVEIWRQLPEDFCRQVEVVNGQAIRCDAPSRPHQVATRRLANLLETAAAEYVSLHPGACLDGGHPLLLARLDRRKPRRLDRRPRTGPHGRRLPALPYPDPGR